MPQATDATHLSRGRLVGALTFLVAVGLPVAAILTAERRAVEVAPGLVDWVFVSGIAVVTIAVFGLLVPWAQRRSNVPKVAFALSTAAIVLLVLFWTMLPLILGAAGAWLGFVGRNAAADTDRRSRLASVAIVLGAGAAVLAVAGYVATS